MDDKIVTLDSYYDPMLAEIVRARLEANGIDCFVADSLTIGANPLYNNAVGGVKVKVFERDIKKCREILAEDLEITTLDEPVADDSVHCPFCDSTNVRYGTSTEAPADWFAAALSLILVAFPFFYPNKTWHCFDCHQEFKKQ